MTDEMRPEDQRDKICIACGKAFRDNTDYNLKFACSDECTTVGWRLLIKKERKERSERYDRPKRRPGRPRAV